MADDLSLDLFGDPAPRPGGGQDGDPPGDPGPPAPTTPAPKVWSVSQVNRAVRSLLETTVDPLWVGGEVTNWTRARSGHCYFTLKDERAQMRCVMWERQARSLPADPEEGMKVRVHGGLTLYEARGEYQMSVLELEAEGAEGLWRLAFEKLRKRLEEEGLLDPARKRPLPRFPRCVGVVTSATGAAVRDVLTVLRRRAPWIRVVVRGTRVQGEGASSDVARALDQLAATGLCDVIVVGRGGGSIEDLWAFNEEPVARAIARCPVPVVSAVGHEVDVTIADLVADVRAPTPSAGAEAVAPDGAALREQLRGVPERLGRGLRGTVVRRRRGLQDRLGDLSRRLDRRMAPLRQTVDRGVASLDRGIARTLERRRQRLAALAGRLRALSPLAVLERGYAVPRTADGRVLKRVEDFPPDDTFVLRVTDGTVEARTLSTHANDTEPA
ncbi:MAG: exodeoxyribonuclease VII large subunit [Longimicrobiales bacterium]